ncbi:hypothetical protein [Globicatella sanguinis]|uniref:hypothetical protein n=1 Tax=Globicatella sanguinis TaxID=13076 RepID=UPI00082535DB|nr:hypothetical protein [Globicatella sanguinis]
MVKVDDRVKMIFVDNKVLTGVVKNITETSYRVLLDDSMINGNIRGKEFTFDKVELYTIDKI